VEVEMDELMHRRSFFVDGGWVDPAGPDRFDVVSPATEQVVGSVPVAVDADIDRAAEAAHDAFVDGPWPRLAPAERADVLARAAELLAKRAPDIAAITTDEMGCAASQAEKAQTGLVGPVFAYYADLIRTFAFDRTVVAGERAGLVTQQPVGPVAAIVPWNAPVTIASWKVAPALAAGCTVVLKPSELSPFTALLFAQVMHDAGTPPGVFNMVMGSGEVVGQAMASHPDVDMVSFTGSTRAGVLVAGAAAPTVKRVIQELGGKSPNVFLPDADFATAVPKAVLGATRNVGQSCAAPTRMVVPRNRLAEVEALSAETAATIVVGDPTDEATALGPLANKAQFEKVQALIQAGIDEGAKLVAGGPGLPPGLNHGYFARPTVFSEVATDMRIAQEEIFGPVVAIQPYADEEDAVRIANATVYGLSSHVQSGDQDAARRFARRIRAGQVHINFPAWSGYAPFGGYKMSGNGREYGVYGLEEYLEVKGILGY
jgi:acyl-CoA reductase-like NAD-dependent aldehyde dehydrogenase